MAVPKSRDTLLSYMRVQENFDRRMYALLRRAASDAEKQITALAGKTNIGAVIRREQLAAMKKALHEQMASILEREGFIIAAGYERAAAAAIKTFEVYDKMLMRTILDDERIQAYLRSARQTSLAGINAARQRLLGTSYIPLSEQVYKTTQLANGLVDRLVESALTRGLTARELALEVRGFILPNVRGGVSYASMRLARTEINNAFHAVQAEKARNTPWITGVQWNLSGSHPDLDECDEYAEEVHFDGGDPGVFLPQEIPQKPHPHCLCFTTPVTVSPDVFLDKYFAGEYDSFVDEVIARDGFILP